MVDPRRLPQPVVAGFLAGCVVLLAWLLAPAGWREVVRERTFDVLLSLAAPPQNPAVPHIVFVDIDPASLAEIGPWPWRRETIARLLEAVAAARPASIAMDMLLSGEDNRSPAALARQLAKESHRSDLAALADQLIDGDKAMIEALGKAPVALGYVLDPRGKTEIPNVPILSHNGGRIEDLWREAGTSGPVEAIANAAGGAGVLSLPGDEDGVVRRVPLFVAAGGEVRPGLALEALRLALGASAYMISGTPTRLVVGDLNRPLPRDSFVRLAPPGIAARLVVRAGDLIGGRADAAPLGGALVIVGSSAPELGGLRPSAADPLTPSPLLHAAAVAQLAAGILPARLPRAAAWESGLALLAIVLMAWLARDSGSIRIAAAVAVLAALAGAAAMLARSGLLVDPGVALAGGTAAYLVTSLAAFVETRRRETRLRQRFEQHLAPAVVARIAADPASLKLAGERREITALFTDIEGFTETTRSIGPEPFIRVLDGYFEGVTKIIVEHGGMIDKFVGDAVHALFNVPFDLPDHPEKALACAKALCRWTEGYRQTGIAADARLGRTRIGIETGVAIVGDVGRGAKVDYTAHGDAVNTAARLEALNKRFGSSICLGPVAAARCPPGSLRPLGDVDIRGIGRCPVFTPIDE